MRPKNFPAKKLRRKLIVEGKDINSEECIELLAQARKIKNKINRGKG